MCIGMLFWGLQRPHSDSNPLGDIRLHTGPIEGLSADDISPQTAPPCTTELHTMHMSCICSSIHRHSGYTKEVHFLDYCVSSILVGYRAYTVWDKFWQKPTKPLNFNSKEHFWSTRTQIRIQCYKLQYKQAATAKAATGRSQKKWSVLFARRSRTTRRRDNSAQGQLNAGDSALGHFGAASVTVT